MGVMKTFNVDDLQGMSEFELEDFIRSMALRSPREATDTE